MLTGFTDIYFGKHLKWKFIEKKKTLNRVENN